MIVGVTLPFEHFSIPTPILAFTPNKIATALMAAFAALQLTLDRRPGRPDPKRLWLIFFAAVLGVGAIQSVALGVSLDSVRRALTTWYALLLFYFLLIYVVRERKDLDLLLTSLVVGCVMAVFSGWAGYGFSSTSARFGTRLGGEGGNPNLLAFNLLIAIGAAASFYFTSRRRSARLASVAALAVMAAGVLTTASRSGIACLGGMLGLWFLRNSRSAARYAIPILGALVAAVLLAPDAAVKRLSTLTVEGVEQEGSAQGRVLMWAAAATAFASNPVTGVGLGRYKEFAHEHPELKDTGIHSAYLSVLAEHGLAGFIPFVAVLALAWREYARAFRVSRGMRQHRDPELGTLGLRAGFLQIAFAGILVQSAVQPSMRHKGLWLMLALATVVVALAWVRAREVAGEETRPLAWAFEPLHPPPTDGADARSS